VALPVAVAARHPLILTAGRERMPRSWLGLAGLPSAFTLLEQFTAAAAWQRYLPAAGVAVL
jgi:hypothetical protein